MEGTTAIETQYREICNYQYLVITTSLLTIGLLFVYIAHLSQRTSSREWDISVGLGSALLWARLSCAGRWRFDWLEPPLDCRPHLQQGKTNKVCNDLWCVIVRASKHNQWKHWIMRYKEIRSLTVDDGSENCHSSKVGVRYCLIQNEASNTVSKEVKSNLNDIKMPHLWCQVNDRHTAVSRTWVIIHH